LAEEREPDAGEGPRPRNAATLENERPRASQTRSIGRIAGELEREVALDAGGEIAWRAVVPGPGSVLALVLADVLPVAAPKLVLAGSEELSEEQVLRIHGGVGLQLGPPEPVTELLAREPPVRTLDGQVQGCPFDRAFAGDHRTPRTCLRGCSSNHRTALASASRTGVCRRPSSRTARWQFANMTSRAVRTPSNGIRGGWPRIRRATKASACASPRARASGIRNRGGLRPEIVANSSINSRIVRFALPRMYRSPRCPRSKASNSPSATSATSIPVATWGGRRPSRKSRMTAPVGVGFTSPSPTGNVGFTITTSRPSRASSRIRASASHLLFL